MVGASLFIIWFIIALLSYLKNRDLLAPSKFYLLYIGIYFAAIFFKDYSYEVYMTYLGLLIVGIVLVIFEPSIYKYKIEHNQISDSGTKNINIKRCNFIIWILSIIPVASQLYLISYMGGIQRYINRIGFRVVDWQGMGLVLESIKLFNILNIVYFALLLLEKNAQKREWLKYLVHLFLLLVFGFLSGSRGGMLGNFVLIVVIYNYLKNKLRIRTILPIIVCLLLIASVIGVARNGYRLTDEGFVSGISKSTGSIMNSKHFEYGITSLELIYSIENNNLKYGLTFITPITNLVPRKLWPSKPDTGGLVFTKIYTGNAWGGYSNLAPGIIGESVVNFGKPFGVIFGIIFLMLIMLFISYIYRKVIYSISINQINLKKLFIFLFYCFVVTTVPGLVQSEWTNTILSLVFRGVKLFGLYIMLAFAVRVNIFDNKRHANRKRIVFLKSVPESVKSK